MISHAPLLVGEDPVRTVIQVIRAGADGGVAADVLGAAQTAPPKTAVTMRSAVPVVRFM